MVKVLLFVLSALAATGANAQPLLERLCTDHCITLRTETEKGLATNISYSGSIKTEEQFKWFLEKLFETQTGDAVDDIVFLMYMRETKHCVAGTYDEAAECLLRRANWYISKNKGGRNQERNR